MLPINNSKAKGWLQPTHQAIPTLTCLFFESKNENETFNKN